MKKVLAMVLALAMALAMSAGAENPTSEEELHAHDGIWCMNADAEGGKLIYILTLDGEKATMTVIITARKTADIYAGKFNGLSANMGPFAVVLWGEYDDEIGHKLAVELLINSKDIGKVDFYEVKQNAQA